MSSVEDHYQAAMDALTPQERVARSMAMLSWTREALARQIEAELGPLPPERLKWEVAKRLYSGDPAAVAMIDRTWQRIQTRAAPPHSANRPRTT